jgi:putative DNA primase/helicase
MTSRAKKVDAADLNKEGKLPADPFETADPVPKLEPAPKADPPDFPLTESGNAERLAAEHGDDMRYCAPWRQWLVWDGRRFKRDDTGEAERRAKETVRNIARDSDATERDSRRKELLAWATRSESAKARTALLQLARVEKRVAVSPEAFDGDPWLFNVENGTVDLRAATRHPHCRSDLITKLAPVAFDPSAACPTWDRFLERIMAGDPEMIEFLQRTAGYALTGDVSAEALFFCVGKGRNGKTTFLATLQELFGDYGRSIRPDLLLAGGTDKAANRASPDLMALCGARLAICSETEEGRALSAATVKQITSRDRIVGRALYAQATEFVPSHKLFLQTNHRPQVRSADEGTWRRILYVPFDVTIPEKDRDPHLLEKLLAERAGILAWAVRGTQAWLAGGCGVEGLKPPAKVRQATKAYREEEDMIAPFLSDACVLEVGAKVGKGELFANYEAWAQRNKEHPVSARTFNARIRDLDGVAEGRTGGLRFWRGIGLVE